MNMNIDIKAIAKNITAEKCVHATMIIFAAASVANIQAFFSHNGHDQYAALAIGAALGGVLVSASIMLSQIDYDNERSTFWIVATITGFIAVLSGTIQTLAYAQHITNAWIAALLGFGLPIGGEMLLAIAASMFNLAHKRQIIRGIATSSQEAVAQTVSEVFAAVDVSKVQKYADRKMDMVIRAQVDQAVLAYLPEVPKPSAPITENGNDGNGQDTPKDGQFAQITGNGNPTLPDANQARYRKIEERRQLIAALITENGPMTIAEITEKLEGAAKEKTVRTDCKELEQDGRLFKDGKRWMVPTLPNLGIPHAEPSQPVYMNGSAA